LTANKYVNISSLPKSKGQGSGGRFVLRISILFLVMTVLRRSTAHWNIIFELEEIESNQVERICYLVLVGSAHGTIVKQVKFIVGVAPAEQPGLHSPRMVPLAREETLALSDSFLRLLEDVTLYTEIKSFQVSRWEVFPLVKWKLAYLMD
jgi:hypothetical protein